MPIEPDLLATAATLLTHAADGTGLDHVCSVIASGLGADGAGLTLVMPDLSRALIAASDDNVRAIEQSQLDLGDGPCTDATETGLLVDCPDLAHPAEDRWPMLIHRLADLPIRAVVAVPLPGGSLDLYSGVPHGLDHLRPDDLSAVAATLTVGLVDLQLPRLTAAQTASRDGINTATRMVMAALDLDADDALARLRARALVRDVHLSDEAGDVLDGTETATLTDAA